MSKIIVLLVLLTIDAAMYAQEMPENAVLMEHIRKLDAAHANAIFKSDFAALDSLTNEKLTINHPRGGIVNGKRELFELIRQGVIKYTSFQRTPERFLFYKDMVVVMGNETVVPAATAPHAGKTLQRRYTDMWMKYDGKWQLQVRHANIVCPN